MQDPKKGAFRYSGTASFLFWRSYEMDIQTTLNIVLGLLTLWLAYRNFVSSSKKDVMRESQEMTEIKVQLNQVMGMLRDMQKDIRTNNTDYRALSERVVKLETMLETAFQQIKELKEQINGKHENQ
jgi:peptidoglycan hydrolase CwlO-like protein